MSRIGKKPISISSSVTVNATATQVTVSGPKGELSEPRPFGVELEISADQVVVVKTKNSRQAQANFGLLRSLVQNMVIGVTEGYTKKLMLVGTGYRAKKDGKGLSIAVGYSHPVVYEPRDGISLDMEGDTTILVSGISKQKVGQTAAEIRAIRKPEPYKGKGIRYADEIIRKKAGKAGKVG